jgi:type IV secretion system protein VirD4
MAGWPEFAAGLKSAMPRGWDEASEPRSPFARWAKPDEVLTPEWTWTKGEATILLGRYQDRLIGRRLDDRHIVTVAGSRAGKGRSLILPNLATWPGSVVAIDPKGELARKTARWRAEGLKQNVVVLDPYKVSGWKTNAYNPFADLNPDALTFLDDVSLIADALIIEDPKDRHWTDAAKNLLRTLVLYMFAEGTEVTLTRLRRILLGAEGKLGKVNDNKRPEEYLFARMAVHQSPWNGQLALLAKSFAEKTEREMESILSTAREQTNFLDSAAMGHVLGESPLRLHNIKRQPTTIYMCLPAARLGTHFRWLRVIINLTLAALEDNYIPKNPVLLLLEEFAVLGHMDAIEKAAGQIAGFGVKLWTILQDMGQLKSIYKDRWETFLGNAGIITCFGLNDPGTLKDVSERLGDTHFLREQRVDLTMNQRSQGASEYREETVISKLLSPEEVGRLFARESGRLMVIHSGRPLLLQRLDASDALFKGAIDHEQQ